MGGGVLGGFGGRRGGMISETRIECREILFFHWFHEQYGRGKAGRYAGKEKMMHRRINGEKTHAIQHAPKRGQLPLELRLVIHELEQGAWVFCIVWRRGGGCRRARGHDGGVVEVVHAEAHTRSYRFKNLPLAS